MSRILALDPGLDHPAIAVIEDGALIYARRVRLDKQLKTLDIADRCASVAGWVFGNYYRMSPPSTIIVEWPQIYTRDKSKGDPNNLVPLAGIACSLVSMFRCQHPDTIEVLSPKPAEVWGRLPKATKGDPWKSPRARRLLTRLNQGERQVIEDTHDALDAAGLALFAAGRWKARKTYSGAV